MKPVWRLIDTGYRTCAQNIALDKALLIACNERLIPDTLRFFQFTSDCVLVGYHQIAEQEVRLSFCQEQSIEINRRLTGGNTTYWEESTLAWETVVYSEGCATAQQIEALTRKTASAIIQGLRILGIDAQFEYPSALAVAGRKIGWLGGTRHGNAVLYQGYIRVSAINVDTMLRALRIPTEKLKNKDADLFKKNIGSLELLLAELPSLDTIKSAIAAGMCEIFAVSAAYGKLQEIEERHFTAAYSEITSQQWVLGQSKAPYPEHYQLRDTSKGQAAITVSMSIDAKQQKIHTVKISGDFQAYPLQLVDKLEAGLCGTAANPELIRKIVSDCFKEQQAFVPGLMPDSFCQGIIRALNKLCFLNWGVSPEELNEITVTGDCAEQDILEQAVTPLLVPYCAKDINCQYRYREGCGRCGRCDIGDAYTLADEYGLEPITIQNYEMLEEKLKNLKTSGCKVFIGTCCESFWVKHAKDFERIGLPGILINVDNCTCYELGKEQEAYQGSFENQTRLKKTLICRIVKGILTYSNVSVKLTS
ncbi:lipoyl protein ligase domain-containing protein [Sporomusa malonica]|uniref:Lipoate-protein ligase A n=1 Tax=Sporomusa malonica TaxID=112901 RepID=A0A1W2ES79_9FIRM|nr:DUF116 domain-containing protein [Sporomusa malonica]SMD12056.1 lipoate-protein ligase A [Sporomusa malonica]